MDASCISKHNCLFQLQSIDVVFGGDYDSFVLVSCCLRCRAAASTESSSIEHDCRTESVGPTLTTTAAAAARCRANVDGICRAPGGICLAVRSYNQSQPLRATYALATSMLAAHN